MIGRGSVGMHMGEDADLKGDDAKPVVHVGRRCRATGGRLRDFSINLRAGEITGVYGFMGSGQIELARALFGKLPLRRGHAEARRQAGAFPLDRGGAARPASPSCRKTGA